MFPLELAVFAARGVTQVGGTAHTEYINTLLTGLGWSEALLQLTSPQLHPTKVDLQRWWTWVNFSFFFLSSYFGSCHTASASVPQSFWHLVTSVEHWHLLILNCWLSYDLLLYNRAKCFHREIPDFLLWSKYSPLSTNPNWRKSSCLCRRAPPALIELTPTPPVLGRCCVTVLRPSAGCGAVCSQETASHDEWGKDAWMGHCKDAGDAAWTTFNEACRIVCILPTFNLHSWKRKRLFCFTERETKRSLLDSGRAVHCCTDFSSTWSDLRWRRRGDFVPSALTQHLFQSASLIQQPAARSGLTPQAYVPLERRCYMITVGLCRGKNVLVPRYPAPPKAQPSPLI